MTELLASIDASGNSYDGEYTYIGIVIGVKDNIDSMIKHLNIDKFSNGTIKNSKVREDLANKLHFNGRDNIAFCIKINRGKTTNYFKTSLEKKLPAVNHIKIFHSFNYHLLCLIRDKIIDFIIKYNYALTELVFECDSDCLDFIKDNGLKSKRPTHVHTLSDIVAWMNNRKINSKDIIDIDVSDEIYIRMKKDFD